MKRRHLIALVAVAGMAAVPGLAQAEESLGSGQSHDIYVGENHLGEAGYDNHGVERRHDEAGYDNHGGKRSFDEAGQEHSPGLDD